MTVEFATVNVAKNGRVSLPAKQRRQVGLEKGGVAIVRVEDGELRIRSVRSVVAEIQEWARPYRSTGEDHSVSLLADRREEALREGALSEETRAAP